MLLPVTCPVCGRAGDAPCSACIAELRPAPNLLVPAGVDRLHALLAYEGAGRELVARLKYRNARASLRWLADGLAGLVTRGGTTVDVVTWAPTTRAHRRERGFDQAELLARALSARLGLPARALLVRAAGGPQTGRSARARHHGPRFELPRSARAAARILLVDDVVTTGATLGAAARTLRGAGAQEVVAAVLARTAPRAR